MIDDISLDEIDDLGNPEATLILLEDEKKYYIVVTTYDETGNESEYSNEICVIIENSSVTDCSPVGDSRRGGGGG